jgi:hypothetical protein
VAFLTAFGKQWTDSLFEELNFLGQRFIGAARPVGA